MNEQHCIAVWTQKRASLVGLHYSRQVALFIVVSSPVSDPLDTAFSLLFFFCNGVDSGHSCRAKKAFAALGISCHM